MVPKIIHYCWFGTKEIPPMEKTCMESWKKYLPDYDVKLWNESNFDLTVCKYAQEAYATKKYAFVSDFCRIYALYEYGGIYFDTDVEVLKSFDKLLMHRAFLGFENRTMVGTAMIALEPHSPIAKDMLDYYYKTPFYDAKGNENLTTNVTLLNKILEKYGIKHENSYQELKGGVTVYPREYFFPKKLSETEFIITEAAYCVHKMSGTWLTARQKKLGSNIFWINVCRPILKKCLKLSIFLLGEDRAKNLEIKVRNAIK